MTDNLIKRLQDQADRRHGSVGALRSLEGEAADTIEAQAREIERLREALARIFAHFDAKNLHHRGNAPGHGHQVPGVWDKDISNGDKGGTPCNWCATWNEARQALQETANDPA